MIAMLDTGLSTALNNKELKVGFSMCFPRYKSSLNNKELKEDGLAEIEDDKTLNNKELKECCATPWALPFALTTLNNKELKVVVNV